MKKGEIWVLELPLSDDREQAGRRPGIFIADTLNDLAIIVPLTSNIMALKLNYSLFIPKSSLNNFVKDSVALVFQVSSLDNARIISKIGNLEPRLVKEVDKMLRRLLVL